MIDESTHDAKARPSTMAPLQGGLKLLQETLALPWLQDILRPLKGAYQQVVWIALAINLIALFTSLFSLQVYDRVIQKGGLVTLSALVIGMIFAIALDQILRQGRGVMLRRIGVRIEVIIAKLVYQRLTRLPALVLEDRPPAFWQTMFRDIELIRATTAGGIALLLVDIPFMFITLLLLAVIAWPLVPVMLVVLLAFLFLSMRSQATLSGGSEQEKRKMMARDAVLADMTAGRMHLKFMGPTAADRTQWQQHYGSWLEESLERSAESDTYREYGQGLSTLSTVVITSIGAIAILNQNMSMGALIAANILVAKLISPLTQLVSQWRSIGQFMSSVNRLDQLFSLPIDRIDTPIAFSAPQGALKLDNVNFKYPGSDAEQLAAISGHIGPKGIYAVVGNNGSGKSTLLKILRGLYPPSEGRVLVDGVDMAQLGQKTLSYWIGYLPQQPRLLGGSVKLNIAMGAQDPTDEKILQAARLAGAFDFIVDLPHGFDTDVGEGGSRFSGGQRKRIAIAQTLINDAPILLLDEPTSDLDTVAEKSLVESLRSMGAHKTIVVVTHSPAVLQEAKGIIVMDRGRVVTAGPAKEILSKLGMTQQGADHV
jgi:ABC-type bacteriocin/lantibiotic exporter with double-glycine peptidase domain